MSGLGLGRLAKNGGRAKNGENNKDFGDVHAFKLPVTSEYTLSSNT